LNIDGEFSEFLSATLGKMTQLSVMLLVVVLCVGQSQSAAGIVVDVILQHVDLLKSQIELLKSRKFTEDLRRLTDFVANADDRHMSVSDLHQYFSVASFSHQIVRGL